MAEFDNKSSGIPVSATTVMVSKSITVEQHEASPKPVIAETISESDLTQLRNRLILACDQGKLGDTLAEIMWTPSGKAGLRVLQEDSRLSLLSAHYINTKISVYLQIHDEQHALRHNTTSLKNSAVVLSSTTNDENTTKKIIKPAPSSPTPISDDDDKPTAKVSRDNPSGRQRTHRYSVSILLLDSNSSSSTTPIPECLPNHKKNATLYSSQLGYTQQAAVKFSQLPSQQTQPLPVTNITTRVSKYVEEQIRSGKAIAAIPGAIVAGYSQYKASKAKGDGVILSVLKADLAAVTTFGTSIAPDAVKTGAITAVEYLRNAAEQGSKDGLNTAATKIMSVVKSASIKGKTIVSTLDRAGMKVGLGAESVSKGAGYLGVGGKFLASRSLTVIGAAQDSWKIVKLGMEKDKIEASNLGVNEKTKKIADINKQEVVVAGQVGGVALASGLAVSAVTVVAVAISAPAWVPLVVGAVASLAVAGAGAKIGTWLGAKIGDTLFGTA